MILLKAATCLTARDFSFRPLFLRGLSRLAQILRVWYGYKRGYELNRIILTNVSTKHVHLSRQEGMGSSGGKQN